MTDEPDRTQHRLVVLDGADRILTVSPEGTARLPSVELEGWADPAELAKEAGDPGAVPCAPPREVFVAGARHLVYVLRGSGATSLPTSQWRPMPELSAVPDHAPLDEPDELRELVARIVAEQTGHLPVPAQRPPWWQSGWQSELDAWIDDRLAAVGRARSGPSVLLKMWSLSAVLRVPTVDGTAVYAKAACKLFAAEPRITRVLAGLFPSRVPTVLAVEESRAWMLMDQLPGLPHEEAGPVRVDAPPELTSAVAEVHAHVQVQAVQHLAQLREAGCPDRTLGPMLAGLDQFVEDSIEASLLTAGERTALGACRRWAADQLAELAGCGLPWTLVHGDLHLGNVAADGDRLVIYDWTDACLSHPFLDAVHLGAPGSAAEDASVKYAAYLAPWRERYPNAQVERAMELAPAANLIFQITSYESILRSQEPDSRFELGGIIAGQIRKLLALAP